MKVSARKRAKRRRLGILVAISLLLIVVLIALIVAIVNAFHSDDEASSSNYSSSEDVLSSAVSAGISSDTVRITSSESSSATSKTNIAATTSKATSAAATKATVSDGSHYVQPDGTDWNLLLVNPWNPLSDTFFSTVPLVDYATSKQFDSRAVEALRSMIKAAKAYNLSALSLFRNVALQTKNYNKEVTNWKNSGYSQADAEAKAATIVARPYTSEHHTGLAVDVGTGYKNLETAFDTTEAFKWLKAHCAEYGFILRFPKDAIAITGVSYEPWHYRYVGVEAATVIMSRGITLEEYLQEIGK
jgi:D-alanyl-D-alanine carboxypeptidase